MLTKIITDLVEGVFSLVVDPLFPPPEDAVWKNLPGVGELNKFSLIFEHKFGF